MAEVAKIEEAFNRAKPVSFSGGELEEPIAPQPTGRAMSKQVQPDWMRRHPNVYGTFGATQDFVPYMKYVDPSERERFNQLRTQLQTRELLLENLKAVIEVGTLGLGPVIAKGTAKITKPIGEFLQKNLPKTYKFLTKDLARTKTIKFTDVQGSVDEIGQPEQAITKGTEAFPRAEVMRVKEMEDIAGIMKKAIKDPDKAFISDPKRRIMYDVYETIKEHPEYTKKILEQYNITPQQLADDVIASARKGGQFLNQLSQIRKSLLKTLGDDPAIKRLQKLDVPKTGWDIVGNIWTKIDRPRRMMMVAQMATAARNAISQAGYYGLRMVEDAIKGTFKVVGGEETPRKAFVEFAEDIGAIIRRLRPSKRKELEKILDKDIRIKSQLLTTPIHDISLGSKASKVIMFFNRVQENVFRKMAFDARVRALSKKHGFNLDDLSGLSDEGMQEFKSKVLEPSLNNALEITFAKTPKTKLPGNVTAKQLIDMWTKIPGLTTIQPFPRFWANSVKFLWDFNPTGFLTAAQRAIINKGGKDSYEAMARATLGTVMLGMAFQVRTSKYAGEKWYEVRTGRKKDGKDEQLDLRAFAPFSSYLFIAEAALQSTGTKPKNLGGYDVAQGVLGINRIAGTGLVFIDALRASSGDTATKMGKRFLGEFLGGYTVGVRSVKDFLTIVNPREKMVGATREKPVTGPILENIPKETTEAFGYKLPEAERITRPGGYEREKPVVRQLTGLTFKLKTDVEKTLDKYGIRHLHPKTGDAVLDRKITKVINPMMNEELTKLIELPQFKEESERGKKAMVRKIVSDIKHGSVNTIGVEHYAELGEKIKGKKARFAFLKSIAKRKRVSFSALGGIVKRIGISLTEKEKKQLQDFYK